jgi:TPP-dependent pyruvate/acetoin dehydrogenase alpha subunit
VADIAARAAGYGLPGVVVDGRDADAVYDATSTAAARARAGGGATLIEAKVDRLHAHYLGDREPYRSADEKAVLWRDDPLERLAAATAADGADLPSLDHEVAAQVAAAVATMRSQPLVDTSTVTSDVYSTTGRSS